MEIIRIVNFLNFAMNYSKFTEPRFKAKSTAIFRTILVSRSTNVVTRFKSAFLEKVTD